MIIIDIILVLIIFTLCKAILYLSHQLRMTRIDRDAAKRMSKLKQQQYNEMKAFADDSVRMLNEFEANL